MMSCLLKAQFAKKWGHSATRLWAISEILPNFSIYLSLSFKHSTNLKKLNYFPLSNPIDDGVKNRSGLGHVGESER